MDKTVVNEIVKKLGNQGISCWMDRFELRPGVNWKKFIKDDWNTISTMAIFFGPHAISEGQQFELDNLLPRLQTHQHVIPVILPTVEKHISAKTIIPNHIKDHVWIDFRETGKDNLGILEWGINGENPNSFESIGSYYKHTSGLEDQRLLISLNEIIRKNHMPLKYPAEVRKIALEIFEDPEDPNYVMCFHDKKSFLKENYGPAATKNTSDRWNLDHIWPKAFGFIEHRTALSDLHNIGISEMNFNSKRSAGFFYDRKLDSITKKIAVEPSRGFDSRGLISRACLYMALRYIGFDNEPKLELNEMELKIGENHLGSLDTLLYWNKISKVTCFERKRNYIIATAQGNRNPFVDKPEFADLLWYPV